MLSLEGRLEAAPGLRVRPVPEWDGCLVFDPGRRRLVELNLAAWLMLELCDGRSCDSLRAAFASIVEGRPEGGRVEDYLRSGLLGLAAAGLIRCNPPDPASEGDADHDTP